MIAVIQRVTSSIVKIENKEIAKIGKGFNILLGILEDDDERDLKKLVKKVLNLRVFANSEGKFDKSILDIKGEILVVSQFTLAAETKKGNRPNFSKAKRPKEAKILYEEFIKSLQKEVNVKSGIFGAMMEVIIFNDGPVTIILDSKKL
jgi:D-tyrosyl-tRNA(Tyr) deacylase